MMMQFRALRDLLTLTFIVLVHLSISDSFILKRKITSTDRKTVRIFSLSAAFGMCSQLFMKDIEVVATTPNIEKCYKSLSTAENGIRHRIKLFFSSVERCSIRASGESTVPANIMKKFLHCHRFPSQNVFFMLLNYDL